jgi:hypothetical protein
MIATVYSENGWERVEMGGNGWKCVRYEPVRMYPFWWERVEMGVGSNQDNLWVSRELIEWREMRKF